MKRMLAMALLSALPALLRADFSYQETTKVTGGAMAAALRFAGAFSKRANQPVETTVYVKGNRMARFNQFTGEVYDLDAKTVTHIDFDKKTYSTMTFEQMREMMDQMMASAKNRKPNPDQPNVQMKFKVSAKETGNTKTIAGYDAKEMLVSIEMDAQDRQSGAQGAANVLSHVWIAPMTEGYAEVRDFQKRLYAAGGLISQQQAGQAQQNMQGMTQVSGEIAKLDGMPVRTVIDMIMANNAQAGQPSGEAQPAQQQQQQQNDSASGGLTGLAARGIFGGFGRKKKDSAADGQTSQAPPGTLMELTTQYAGFSSGAVDASKLDVPAGFKQVQPETVRPGR